MQQKLFLNWALLQCSWMENWARLTPLEWKIERESLLFNGVEIEVSLLSKTLANVFTQHQPVHNIRFLIQIAIYKA